VPVFEGDRPEHEANDGIIDREAEKKTQRFKIDFKAGGKTPGLQPDLRDEQASHGRPLLGGMRNVETPGWPLSAIAQSAQRTPLV